MKGCFVLIAIKIAIRGTTIITITERIKLLIFIHHLCLFIMIFIILYKKIKKLKEIKKIFYRFFVRSVINRRIKLSEKLNANRT